MFPNAYRFLALPTRVDPNYVVPGKSLLSNVEEGHQGGICFPTQLPSVATLSCCFFLKPWLPQTWEHPGERHWRKQSHTESSFLVTSNFLLTKHKELIFMLFDLLSVFDTVDNHLTTITVEPLCPWLWWPLGKVSLSDFQVAQGLEGWLIQWMTYMKFRVILIGLKHWHTNKMGPGSGDLTWHEKKKNHGQPTSQCNYLQVNLISDSLTKVILSLPIPLCEPFLKRGMLIKLREMGASEKAIKLIRSRDHIIWETFEDTDYI